jgi:hypothetical protein
VSEKGGPAAAVAAFNALLLTAAGIEGSRAGWGADGTADGPGDDGASW